MDFIRISSLVLAVALALLGCQQGRNELVVVSFGGQWQKAQRRAMLEPFSSKRGVRIIEREYSGDYTLIREKGAAGEWDVVDVEPAELLRGVAENIYEPIDYSLTDTSALIKSAIHKYGVGLMTYSIVLGYSTEEFSPTSEAPTTWSDFWNLERFPGKRGLHNSPQWMLEIALLADGVSPDSLYPLDLDRAFTSLDRIKDYVITFEAWAQPAEMIDRGDVVMSAGTNGRLISARDEGKKVAISWEGGIVASDYFVILKGSPKKRLAQELVAFSVSDEAQQEFPKHINYGPVNMRVLPKVEPETRANLPTAESNLEKQVFFNGEWWADHKSEAIQRYNKWLLSD